MMPQTASDRPGFRSLLVSFKTTAQPDCGNENTIQNAARRDSCALAYTRRKDTRSSTRTSTSTRTGAERQILRDARSSITLVREACVASLDIDLDTALLSMRLDSIKWASE